MKNVLYFATIYHQEYFPRIFQKLLATLSVIFHHVEMFPSAWHCVFYRSKISVAALITGKA